MEFAIRAKTEISYGFCYFSSGDLVDVELINDGTLISPVGTAYVNVQLPGAESVSLSTSCSSNNIALSSDPASQVFGYATSCQIYVSLLFVGNPF